MRIHNLKTWPKEFQAIRTGEKTVEVRLDDGAHYQAGDLLLLREWDSTQVVG